MKLLFSQKNILVTAILIIFMTPLLTCKNSNLWDKLNESRVHGITLNNATMSLVAPGTYQLVATITPANSGNPTVTWTSSDSTKVSVNATGLIAGVSGGSATVTASVMDGEFTATCVVSVSASAVPVINYTSSTYIFTEATSVTLTPVLTGGIPISFSISPSLPGGFTLSNTTGVISGTPTAAQGAITYTVTATNADGSDNTTISIEVWAYPILCAWVYNGNMYTSKDYGVTWQSPSTVSTWAGVSGSTGGNQLLAWAGGWSTYQYLYKSPDFGVTWTQLSASGSQAFAGVGSSDSGSIIAATVYDGSNSNLYYSTDSGSNWSMTPLPGTYWSSIHCDSSGTRWVTYNGGAGSILVFIYLGTFNTSTSTWNWYQATPLGPGTGSISGPSASNLYNSIGYMISKGGNKVFVSYPDHLYLSNSTMAADFSNAGLVSSWTEIGNPGTGMTHGTMSGDGNHLFVVYNNRVYRSGDNGTTWSPSTALPLSYGDESVASVVTTDDGSAVAVYTTRSAYSNQGYIYVSTDGGQNFTQNSVAGYKTWGGVTLEPH